MKPLPPAFSSTVTDCWLFLPAAARYMGISTKTLRRRNEAGLCLPHGTDPVSGRPIWLRSRLDTERTSPAMILTPRNIRTRKRSVSSSSCSNLNIGRA